MCEPSGGDSGGGEDIVCTAPTDLSDVVIEQELTTESPADPDVNSEMPCGDSSSAPQIEAESDAGGDSAGHESCESETMPDDSTEQLSQAAMSKEDPGLQEKVVPSAEETTSAGGQCDEQESPCSNKTRDSPAMEEKSAGSVIEKSDIRGSEGPDTGSAQQRELEATVSRLERELNATRERLADHDASAKKTIMSLQNDMRARLDNLGRLCEENRKEKEAMVLKYAQAEHKTMEIQKRVRDLEGRLREGQREKDGLVKQSRVLRQEKDRLQSLYENKCTEMAALEKELIVSKDSVNSVEVKVKWHQNKLKEEADRHKETRRKLEDTQKALNSAKEETEIIRANCQQIIRQYQEAEEVRSNSLGVQLKQKENELKQTQAENYVQQEVHQKAVKDLEHARKSARESSGELRTLRDKVKCLEAERMCQEEAASQAKERALRMKTQRDQLAERVRSLESTAADAAERAVQLDRVTAELEAAKEARADMEAETERARARETELLEFTQRLSDRNAALQAENLTQKTSLDELHAELTTLSSDLDKALQTVEEQQQRLAEMQTSHTTETEELSRALGEKTRTCEELSVMLADERNEIRTLKKKHAANTKDLTRQLAACRRKLDAKNSPLAGLPIGPSAEEMGHSLHPVAASSNGDSLNHHASPSSSTSSLDIAFPAMQAGHVGTTVSVDAAYPSDPATNSLMEPEIKMIMPDRQALIDKIVRLQRQNARHNEKMDFLQEHVSQLTEQLKKKNRLLQHFILREESGCVTPEDFDLNKAALARKGGIMASVYSSHASDQGMTLDLSLEITRKLQAVLEDTLLKNITLKDNLNTLGEEISRLSRENREMQLNAQTPS